MMGNPVMFVVEVGIFDNLAVHPRNHRPDTGVTNTGFELQITLWLWFTVLFANFAERWLKSR